ncbi:S-crystallin SL11-like [Mizuhopecten yessoensis]|uniref:S-crystallin SL11 n=1 Tax=Mizuhopecten yessoensis TaxID=6573 RepID=A0A210PWF9_MIZYE|nr:S-crystallin SL11-like [Mizuhopecten yessoensis]OWF40796.1 S-crystallin SL11 [Mizuhopecten yessoensis]
MTKFTLYYFDGRGRAEVIRLLFALSDKKFEDIRIAFDKWPEHKQNAPGGTLPYLEIDGKKYGQSSSLGRYLAREWGFYGKTSLDQLNIDEIVDDIADYRTGAVKVMFEKDDAKKAELLKTHTEKTIPEFVTKMEKKVSANKSGFLAGSACSLADLALFDIMDGMSMKYDNVFASGPKVKAHMEKIAALPKIKAYLAKRPKTDF